MNCTMRWFLLWTELLLEQGHLRTKRVTARVYTSVYFVVYYLVVYYYVVYYLVVYYCRILLTVILMVCNLFLLQMVDNYFSAFVVSFFDVPPCFALTSVVGNGCWLTAYYYTRASEPMVLLMYVVALTICVCYNRLFACCMFTQLTILMANVVLYERQSPCPFLSPFLRLKRLKCPRITPFLAQIVRRDQALRWMM